MEHFEIYYCVNFIFRANPSFIESLGHAIHCLCTVIPKGVLVFFPSYEILEWYWEIWQGSGRLRSIRQCKEIFREPKSSTELEAVKTNYFAAINRPNSLGAMLMAVYRGKVSEGLDFENDYARAVIIIGLPYAPKNDPKVQLKWNFLDAIKGGNAGWDWYQSEAVRTVNQAIGRLIRNKNDYGAILLLDHRYNNYDVQISLCEWIRQQLQNQTLTEVVNGLTTFYQNNTAYENPQNI